LACPTHLGQSNKDITDYRSQFNSNFPTSPTYNQVQQKPQLNKGMQAHTNALIGYNITAENNIISVDVSSSDICERIGETTMIIRSISDELEA
jgi:hypothetical protein